MPLAAFDTLKFANHLKAAGVADKHAEAQASALVEALQSGLEEVASKGDIKDVKNDLALLDAKIDRIESSLRGELMLLKWMLGATFTGVATILVRLFFFRIG